MRLDWDRVLTAWALVFVLILATTAALQTRPIDHAEAKPALRGVKIPQHGLFNLGPPAFRDDLAGDPAAAEVDD